MSETAGSAYLYGAKYETQSDQLRTNPHPRSNCKSVRSEDHLIDANNSVQLLRNPSSMTAQRS